MKIYIAIVDGGDGSYSLRKFKSAEDYNKQKENEEKLYGYSTDDNGGYVIDTDNLQFDEPDEVDEEDEEFNPENEE